MSVIANSAPHRCFASSTSMSRSIDSAPGWPPGKAATPTLKPPWSRASDTSSHGVGEAALGRGPLGARALGRVAAQREHVVDPASAYAARIDSSSSRVWPTQVRWAIGSIEVSRAIRPVTRTVVSRELPPAPYVTETKVGR